MVIHPPGLAQQLPQDQKPDRIYGLRQTRNIEGLMLKRLAGGGFLEDVLQKQPHSTLGEALLFPFLVVEAKSGIAPDDWHSIRLQTAFPIHTYLNTQQSLRLATAQRSRWTSGPLVWFFMSRGDDWRLCLAYQSPARTAQTSARPGHTTVGFDCFVCVCGTPIPQLTRSQNMVTVWTGCITNRDDALQLFLIVDYMSDWARDVYRTAIIRELRVLAAPDTDLATVFTDTDIFSSGHVVLNPSLVTGLEDPDAVPEQNYPNPQAAFKRLDSALGVVRHAAPIESRFRALFLTEDNIHTFVDSTSNHIRESFIRQIIRQFSPDSGRPVALTPDQISSVEEKWTGHSRLKAPFPLRDKKLYTVYNVAYSLLPSWDQMRELCLIAIEEQAFDVLVARSRLKAAAKSKPSAESDSSVLEDIAWLKRASVEQNLLACISRACGRVERRQAMHSLDQSPRIRTWRRLRRCNAAIWLLLSYTYKFHKKGDLEPNLPFLRISGLSEIQGAVPQNVDGAANLDVNDLEASSQGAVLIYGDCHRHLPGRSKTPICVYLVRESLELPNQDELGLIIKRTFEDHDVYHTTRNYGTLNPRNVKESQCDIWNLERPYGVFFSYGKSSFVKWLRRLGEPLPTRQGSPRGRHATGRVMFERNYGPWHDPRLIYGVYNREKKKFFKRLFVAEVTAWARIAQELISQGNDCCPLCATVDPARGDDLFDSEFESEDGDHDGGGSNGGPDLASTPGPSSQNQDQGGSVLSRSERDTKSQTDSEGRLAHTFAGVESDLCVPCAEDLSIYGRWPAWLKKVIRETLGKAISAAATNDTPASDHADGYCISTPPRRPWRSRLGRQTGSYINSEQSSPSDSEPESENGDRSDGALVRLSRGDLWPDDVTEHAEDQADGPDSTLASASPPRGKRVLSVQSDGEAPLKRRRGSVPGGRF